MRSLQVTLVLLAALFGSASASYAQTAYDYPWCAVYPGGSGPGGAMSCYYRSYGQCMETMSGIGGYCTRSPYYGEGRHERRRYRDY